ncbi:alkaline phosphatase family protein [Gordonia hydrophobica]|uniref:Alkaline phosphatase family protein n=1 Tax=Gordonia hydrophobica TaxID=40516 RepID=A0ABZ2TZ23_9ACTN|nr:nucleotide pyrophosphatase/phosphodiesterase family protein [Gordonia hydrophobica]MBM7369465.1 putative AlkP superfamily pyrophosphatase or phosphodiesterase [Gordonia hydrophobica]
MRFTLADVLPNVALAFGGDADNPLGVRPARDVVVLLIDGLGAELLARHAHVAPTLAAHVQTKLRAGFPATTATSITSLAVGAPCATHGIIGYSFAVPTSDGTENFNALRWRTRDADGPDARTMIVPEEFQPTTSTVAHLASTGIDIHFVVPGYQMRSGLTRAAFGVPGALHDAPHLDDVRDGILSVAAHPDTARRFAYAYYPQLDAAGHVHGPESAEWLRVLADIDAMVAELLTDLPATCTLLITGDHGMITVGDAVDLDADPRLQQNVRLISGEARVRHVYADSTDAVADVAAVWTTVLADHAQVVTREQALDEHWFGATPPIETIAARIGDVMAVAQGTSVLVRPEREPMESSLAGHHGAWTDDEQLVPLISAPTSG